VSLLDFERSKNHPDAQTSTVQKMEVNVTIDNADFALPASLKTGAAADKK